VDDKTGVDNTDTGASDNCAKVEEFMRRKTYSSGVGGIATDSSPPTRLTEWQLIQTKTHESFDTLCDVLHFSHINCCSVGRAIGVAVGLSFFFKHEGTHRFIIPDIYNCDDNA
jgi:hypothetical protein